MRNRKYGIPSELTPMSAPKTKTLSRIGKSGVTTTQTHPSIVRAYSFLKDFAPRKLMNRR